MTRTILSFVGPTVDNNINQMGLSILAAFARQGWDTATFDPLELGMVEAMRGFYSRLDPDQVSVTLSVQGMGYLGGVHPRLPRRLLWGLDHPAHTIANYGLLPPGSVVTVPTRGNMACFLRHVRSDVTLACVPHSADPVDPLPWSQRDIDILMVGNRSEPEEVAADWSLLGEEWPVVLRAMTEVYHQASGQGLCLPLEIIVAEVLAGFNIRCDSPMQLSLMQALDKYLRAWVRVEMVRRLADLPVTLVGRDWDAEASPSHHILGPRPAEEVAELSRRARIALNLLPNYYASHERVFRGMAAAVGVVSTGQGYIANVLDQEQCRADFFTLRYGLTPDEIADKVAGLLADQHGLRDMAEAGRDEFLARHTYDHRVAQVIGLLETT